MMFVILYTYLSITTFDNFRCKVFYKKPTFDSRNL